MAEPAPHCLHFLPASLASACTHPPSLCTILIYMHVRACGCVWVWVLTSIVPYSTLYHHHIPYEIYIYTVYNILSNMNLLSINQISSHPHHSETVLWDQAWAQPGSQVTWSLVYYGTLLPE